jgi:pimeloyl-ACP methyl ester carboxylesterase
VGVVSQTFAASDGVSIAYQRTGNGRLLVLVHGGATDHGCFNEVLDFLTDFTTVTYDRRGHGMSSDRSTYSLAREAMDLVELVEHVRDGDDVFVLAYSYGATITLHALTTISIPVRAAVLYEPPMADDGIAPAAAEILDLVNDERYEEALRLFLMSTFYLSDSVVDAMHRDPRWTASVDLVANLRRELPVVRVTTLDTLRVVAPPTRVLVTDHGGNPAFHRIASNVARVLPNCDVVGVPGLPHFAMATDPGAFVRAAREHLDRYDEPQGITA